jgi:FixJ family two-component response regulator
MQSSSRHPARDAAQGRALRHIVVVEDDSGMRDAIRRVLHMEGFTTETFASAEAAQQCGAAARADCLVLDVRLPGQSGIQFREALKHGDTIVPAVFITAYDDFASRQRVLERDCVYLIKPFPGEMLVQAIREASARCAQARKPRA